MLEETRQLPPEMFGNCDPYVPLHTHARTHAHPPARTHARTDRSICEYEIRHKVELSQVV